MEETGEKKSSSPSEQGKRERESGHTYKTFRAPQPFPLLIVEQHAILFVALNN